jgi:hypothetical protein
MDRTQYAAARASALARMLTGAPNASNEQLASLVCRLLEAAGLSQEQRVEVLGGAFVAESVSPHWVDDDSADAAHRALRVTDEELADAVEAVAQVVLGRAQSREDAADALAELERMFVATPVEAPPPQLRLPDA